MITFMQWLEAVDGLPETDEEAKLRLPSDQSVQLMYDELRKQGKSTSEAWNACVQHRWNAKKQGFAPAATPENRSQKSREIWV